MHYLQFSGEWFNIEYTILKEKQCIIVLNIMHRSWLLGVDGTVKDTQYVKFVTTIWRQEPVHFPITQSEHR